MAPLDRFSLDSGHCHINGLWHPPSGREYLTLHNPSTGEPLCAVARGQALDIDHAVEAATRAMRGAWGRSTGLERGRLLCRLGNLVNEHAEALAELEALDVGKPLKQARADTVALARYCEFYAGAADKLHGQTVPYDDGYTVYTLREPHGVTAHIVPWNYPMQIIGRSVVAALAAGNAAVLKPAEEACLTALAFVELARRAGLPDGVLNIVPGLGTEAGSALSAHPGVYHVSFTGSFETGVKVQQAAASNAVPLTLELGGKSAQLVFDDADLDAALPFLVNSGIQNAGQTCSAASRILAHRAILPDLVDRLATRYRSLRVGPAMKDLDLGPLISRRQEQIVRTYLERGKTLVRAAQGTIIDSAPATGNYVEPVLFAEVPAGHVLAQEEIFGPVQVVIGFDDETEAVQIANGTAYGLVAAAWTRDGARQMRLARALTAGQVFINNYGAGGGVELPFGGVRKSGYGREKGFEALYGFTRLKTVAAWHG